MKATRVFQIAALLTVIVAVVQVGWWALDQHNRTVEKVRNERLLYSQQVAAAEELLKADVPAEKVARIFPGLTVRGESAIAPSAGDAASPRVSVAARVNEALAPVLRSAPFPVQLIRNGSLFWLALSETSTPRAAITLDQKAAARFAALFHALLARGIYWPPSAYEVCFLSLAQEPADFESLAHALRESLAVAAREVK